MTPLCSLSDLISNAGVCALHDDEQVALFYLPDSDRKVYAVSNLDPFTKANVLSRGIVGSVDGKRVVASPIYKQHFELETGQCLEDEDVVIKTFDVDLIDDQVVVR